MDKKTIPLELKETEQKSLAILLQGSSSLINRSSGDHGCYEQENVNDRICASELFSLFTADVIKEEVIFVR